jgi:hypothetical protein
MDLEKLEELLDWLDNCPEAGEQTRRELLHQVQPSLLSATVLKSLEVIAPKKA